MTHSLNLQSVIPRHISCFWRRIRKPRSIYDMGNIGDDLNITRFGSTLSIAYRPKIPNRAPLVKTNRQLHSAWPTLR